MAAGVGSRISRHLRGQPKCCVDVNGKPLIRYTLELFKKKGISNIAIVTGYNEHYIHQSLDGFLYTRYFNPFFRVANSISSAWFAQVFLKPDDDMIIMNADVFIEEKILGLLLEETKTPLMISDSTRIEEADYRFNWENNSLKKYGKDLSNEETTGEYVGIARLNKEDLIDFREQVNEAVITEDYHCWWEDIIYRSIGQGKTVYIQDIANNFWAEVDYIEDYERIKQFVQR